MDREAFGDQIIDALGHIRDVVHLRTMPLARLLADGVSRQERGWELSRRLLDGIADLRPRDNIADDDWVRLRYDILCLRYTNGLSPDTVAQQLSMSRRHFFRQQRRALDEYTEHMWAIADRERDLFGTEGAAPDAINMLRRESEPLLGAGNEVQLKEGVEEVLGLLHGIMKENGITVDLALEANLPPVALNHEILRQLLLGLLGRIAMEQRDLALELSCAEDRSGIELKLIGLTPRRDTELAMFTQDMHAMPYAKLASMHGVSLSVQNSNMLVAQLPTESPAKVLVADDNIEVCDLMGRILRSAGYQVIVAHSGAEAIDVATSSRVGAIILDLMMNNDDGWDVLQRLRHSPLTEDTPIIVCSVLDQGELALVFGASAYLRKPVTRDPLLDLLARFLPSRSTLLQRSD